MSLGRELRRFHDDVPGRWQDGLGRRIEGVGTLFAGMVDVRQQNSG